MVPCRLTLVLVLCFGLGRPAGCAKASAGGGGAPEGAAVLDELGSAQGAVRREGEGPPARGGAAARGGQAAVQIGAGGEVLRSEAPHGAAAARGGPPSSARGAVQRERLGGDEAPREGAAAGGGPRGLGGEGAVRRELLPGGQGSSGEAAVRRELPHSEHGGDGAVRRELLGVGEVSPGGAAARGGSQGSGGEGAVRRELPGGGEAAQVAAALSQDHAAQGIAGSQEAKSPGSANMSGRMSDGVQQVVGHRETQAEPRSVSGHLGAAPAQDTGRPAPAAGGGSRAGEAYSRPSASRDAEMLPAMMMVTNTSRESEGQAGLTWSPLHCVVMGFLLLVFSNAGAWLWTVWPWRLARAQEERL